MTTNTSLKPDSKRAFPRLEVEGVIHDFMKGENKKQKILRGRKNHQKNKAKTQPEIDSLVVVELFLLLEEWGKKRFNLNVELPIKLIQPGGYESVDEVMKDIMPKLKKEWNKSNNEKVYGRKN